MTVHLRLTRGSNTLLSALDQRLERRSVALLVLHTTKEGSGTTFKASLSMFSSLQPFSSSIAAD